MIRSRNKIYIFFLCVRLNFECENHCRNKGEREQNRNLAAPLCQMNWKRNKTKRNDLRTNIYHLKFESGVTIKHQRDLDLSKIYANSFRQIIKSTVKLSASHAFFIGIALKMELVSLVSCISWRKREPSFHVCKWHSLFISKSAATFQQERLRSLI